MLDPSPTRDDLALDLVAVRLRLDDLRSYVTRGRALQHLSDADLAERFASATRAWSFTPLKPPRDLDDCGAEYFLRDEEPPQDLAAIARVMEQLAPDIGADYGLPNRLQEAALDQDKVRQLKS